MKATIEINITSCVDCPFTENINEHGCCGQGCLFQAYTFVKNEVPEYCPLINPEKVDMGYSLFRKLKVVNIER